MKRTVSGKYKDIIEEKENVTFDADNMTTSIPFERVPLYCIPVPGETPWIKEANRIDTPVHLTNGHSSKPKRKEPDQETTETTNGHTATSEDTMITDSVPTHEERKVKTDTENVNSNSTNGHTIPDETLGACLVKVYDDKTDGHFKLNDVVEFVGILSTTPQLTNFER
jgi:hypothetical protein